MLAAFLLYLFLAYALFTRQWIHFWKGSLKIETDYVRKSHLNLVIKYRSY